MSGLRSKSRASSRKTQRVVSSAVHLPSVSKITRDGTPSTISTKGTSTTTSSTPDCHDLHFACDGHKSENETRSSSLILEKENVFKSGSRRPLSKSNPENSMNNCGAQKHQLKSKDSSDILAQWRRERHEHQKLNETENFQRSSDGNANAKANYQRNGDDAIKRATEFCSREAPSEDNYHSGGDKGHFSHYSHKSKANSQTPAVSVLDPEMTDDEGIEGVDTSAVTTPTGNTALNSVGMERLYKNKNKSSGVCLFPASQEPLQPIHSLVYHDKAIVDNHVNEQIHRKNQELRHQHFENTEVHKDEGDSIDVSLMTQDTDMIYLESIVRDTSKEREEAAPAAHAVNRKDKKISFQNHSQELPVLVQSYNQNELLSKNPSNHQGNENDCADTSTLGVSYPSYRDYDINTLKNQNDVAKVLSTLQSSLEQSKIIRSRQEKELRRNQEIITQLKQQNQESFDYKNSIRNSIGELIQQVNGLQDSLNFDGNDQLVERSEQYFENIECSVDETVVLRDISNVIRRRVVNKVPKLLEHLHESTNKVQAAKAEFKKVSLQVQQAKERQKEQTRQHEEEWTLRQQQINQEEIKIHSKIQTKLKKLELVKKDLLQSDQVLEELRNTQQKLEQSKSTLSNITSQVLEKGEELADIERICEERIQSAHKIENDAQELAEEANNEKGAAKKLHDDTMKKLNTIKSMEKAAKIERQELESERLTLKTEVNLEHNQIATERELINEERRQLKGIEESLESRRSQLMEENERIKSVQNQLLEVEAVTEEKLLILDEKEAGIKKREDDICNRESEIAERRQGLDFQLEESTKRSIDLQRVETDLNNRLLTLQQKEESFREEQQNSLERSSALEKRENELEADRNQLTIKASRLSATVKSAKEDTEKRRLQLDEFESQLREKEKTLAEQSRILSSQDNDLTEKLKGLAEEKEKMTHDKLNFERNLKEKSTEHTELLAQIVSKQAEEETKFKNLTEKTIATEKSYNKLCSDIIKVKEVIKNKVSEAQSKLQEIDTTMASKKNELMGLQEMAQSLCKEIDDSNKAKDEISDTIRRKEKILSKVEGQIISGKEAWARDKHEKQKEMQDMINVRRREVEEQCNIIREQTMSKMTKINNDLAFRQEEASSKLSSRARQIDLLHSKLSKVTRQTLMERKQIQEERHVWEVEESGLKVELKESLELIRRKDDEISSYLQAKKTLEASLDSSTAHELILTKSLQSKDKEIEQIVLEKKVLDQKMTDYERQLSTHKCSTKELEKMYEDKIISLKAAAERDMKISTTRHVEEKGTLNQKIANYEQQLSTLKSSNLELEKVYKEKILSLKTAAERDMKLAITQHDKNMASREQTETRMNMIKEDEFRLIKEREDLKKRTNALQKSEERINRHVEEMERKESNIASEAKEIQQSKLLIQEEKELMHIKTESLRHKEDKLNKQTLQLSTLRESFEQEKKMERAKLDECHKIIDSKKKEINEEKGLLEKRAVESNANEKVQEKELETTRTELSDRLKSIKVLEKGIKSRMASTEQKEEAMTLKYNEMFEKLSLEQDKLSQDRQLLNEERKKLSVSLNELKEKEDVMDRRIEVIKNQETNNTETEKRLKEYTQSLKNKGKDIRAKEKNMQNIARLLKDRQTKSSSNDAARIAELQKTISAEQKQYQELVEVHAKQKAYLRAKEEELSKIQKEGENIGPSEASQQRMRQLALQLKQKDDELMKREENLQERISKCDECESTLAAWNIQLDGIAATFDSMPENNKFRQQPS